MKWFQIPNNFKQIDFDSWVKSLVLNLIDIFHASVFLHVYQKSRKQVKEKEKRGVSVNNFSFSSICRGLCNWNSVWLIFDVLGSSWWWYGQWVYNLNFPQVMTFHFVPYLPRSICLGRRTTASDTQTYIYVLVDTTLLRCDLCGCYWTVELVRY